MIDGHPPHPPPPFLLALSPPSDLIHCTNEMNVNIPQLADTLFERTANTSWVVVFKSLTTTHHLMVYGNEVRTSVITVLHLCWIGWKYHGLFNSNVYSMLAWDLRLLSSRRSALNDTCLKVSCSFHKVAVGKSPLCKFLIRCFSCRDLYSIWLQGTHYSTSATSWTKVAYKVYYQHCTQPLNTPYSSIHLCHDIYHLLFVM